MDATSNTLDRSQLGDTPRVWTLTLMGGHPFQVKIPMTPLLDHDGTWSLWKVHCTQAEMEQIRLAVKPTGAILTCYTESQTAEQHYERMELLGLEPTEPLGGPPDPEVLLTEWEEASR